MCWFVFFFFFKQKTAYEMRISDWSSDVCSSDLSALPARRVSNAELAQTVDTSDEWIVERTGIRFRHIASPEETTATLAADAGRAAIAAAGVAAQDVDLTVLATATPDQTFPSSATKVQAMLGLNQ